MNKNEYGIQFNFNVNFNIAGFTSLSLAISRPDGTALTLANPAVSVGNAPLVTPDGTYNANEYAKYVFVNNDINQAGTYSARLTYTDASKRLISDPVTFDVNP